MAPASLHSASFSAVGSDFLLKQGSQDGDLFIAGYASVDMVDKQGDRIPGHALKKAFGKFMSNKAFRNVQLAHSGIQVGEVVDSYTDSEGRVWKSDVDEHGLFVVCRIRDDIQKAREVQKQVRSGELRSFSIGGQALFRVSKTTPEHGAHREITDLELHEITLCKKGINPEARYSILKMDGETDMATNDALNEIRDGLTRVLKHIDGGELSKKEKEMKEMKEEKMYAQDEEEDDPKKSEVDATDALAYIDSLEKFAHENGVNLDALRDHFGLEKAYMVGVDGQGGYSHRGQGDEIGSGEDASEPSYPALPSPGGNNYVIKNGGVPSMNMNAPSGNNQVIKAGDLTPEALERGYRAYAAIRDEEVMKGLVEQDWASRYDAETKQAAEVRKANDFGGQIAALRDEIASLNQQNADIQKSAVPVPSQTSVRVPTPDEYAQMGSGIDGWRAAEELARRALRGE